MEHVSLSQYTHVSVCFPGTRFVPKAEERLLAVVHALLHRCYKMPFSNNAEVPASLKKELSGTAPALQQSSMPQSTLLSVAEMQPALSESVTEQHHNLARGS